jgi:hypothetical protein
LDTPIRTFFGASAAKAAENITSEINRKDTTSLKLFFIVRLLIHTWDVPLKIEKKDMFRLCG